jgi:hypothetical protein
MNIEVNTYNIDVFIINKALFLIVLFNAFNSTFVLIIKIEKIQLI